jgi:acyl-CoA thioesterase
MTPAQITDQMMAADAFSQWLGIERIEDGLGRCILRMSIRPEMLNGFGIAHGGITYALADSALAFASNSRGRQAVSVETSISHTRPLRTGDLITATATEEHLGSRIAVYRVEVSNAEGQLVALFKGTVFRTEKEWS